MNKKIFSILFFAIFSVITGVGIVVPLLPVFAHDIGASGLYIGLIFGSFSLSRMLFLPYFGKLSDKKERKSFITIGLFIYAIVSVFFMMSKDLNVFIGLRFIQGIASAMILPVAQAYIGDLTPEGKEGTIMGLFNISLYGSLSLGPVLGGIINDYFNLQAAFFCMGLFAFLSFLLCLFFLPSKENKGLILKKEPLSYRILVKDSMIASLFIFRLAYTTCIGIVWAFLPVIADSKFSLSSSSIGFLVMLGVLVAGLLQMPMGFMADRFDKTKLIITGGIISGIAILLFPFATGFWHLFIANILFGIGGGIAMPSIMALSIIAGNKTNSMGSVMALLTIGHSLGMLFGSVGGGILMDFVNLDMAFNIGFIFIFSSIVFFVFAESKE